MKSSHICIPCKCSYLDVLNMSDVFLINTHLRLSFSFWFALFRRVSVSSPMLWYMLSGLYSNILQAGGRSSWFLISVVSTLVLLLGFSGISGGICGGLIEVGLVILDGIEDYIWVPLDFIRVCGPSLPFLFAIGWLLIHTCLIGGVIPLVPFIVSIFISQRSNIFSASGGLPMKF